MSENHENMTDQENAMCDITIVHQDILDKVKKEITDDDTLYNMAGIFKVLSDPTRLKIINALMLSEMCVCDIAALLNMSKPAISHHLKSLRQTHLIKYRRDGKIAYYSLNDAHIKMMFDLCITHIKK
ncbi:MULTISPECIES: ArsR/SmtB family transcription factor [Eubacteriales]|jgi:ArsR family transcriptional regulator|uniref:Winged helix-turn-helix transcriptional regulator n=1 Tax=Caproicibacterium amylolyticum TaxID=2766537 RepID=A0A7G9WFZ9_9FIRM|nr:MULTISPECIES: metalloregulator ArsR/SmtB family transcription factor [Eubacteriales]QNO17611.1 winged helix-turn-helix transcriptional regulator [Caproicibacterium amylolyticum]